MLACFRQEDLEEYEDDSDEGFSLSDAIRLSHEAREKEVLLGAGYPPGPAGSEIVRMTRDEEVRVIIFCAVMEIIMNNGCNYVSVSLFGSCIYR